jgi:hypothetical protein
MIITNHQWGRIYHYLEHNWKACTSVLQLLIHGDEKHAEDEASAQEHIKHALAHLAQHGDDEETGEPHWAHAVARLILAIETIIQRGSKGAE